MVCARYKNGNLSSSTRQKHIKRLNGLRNFKRGSVGGDISSSGDDISSSGDDVSSSGDATHGEANGMADDCVNKLADDKSTWLEGRRVVEFSVLLNDLRMCTNCKQGLSLLNIVKETKMGLGSLFQVKCEHCLMVNTVATGKRHSNAVGAAGDSGSQCRSNIFDVNTKLATAMIHAGIGEQQMNNVLACLNLPTISHKTLKRREREISTSIISAAEQSCQDAVIEEIRLLQEVNTTLSEDDKMKPEVGADGGWQQRGSGHNYNSQSGHVTVLGKLSKKCVSYGVAKKKCRFCSVAKASKKTPGVHKCFRNWNGSSKAMEPFLTIRCLQEVKSKGLSVGKLTMDDDTSTYVRAKRSLFPQLEKNSDRNHVIKNFSSGLYKLRDTHKSLTVQTINYLKKCFSYATAQNKGSPSDIRNNIMAIVPHAYGDHSKCSENWCKAKNNLNYKHSSLSGGKDLSNKSMRTALDEYFARYISQEMANKLANLGSTNGNENLNNMISKKAPKNVNFSESESLETRIAAAISQKNEGHRYILNVNHLHGLSPGKSTRKRLNTLDTRRRRKAERAERTEQKRRRIQLKEERLTGGSLRELEEGATYESGISCVGSSIVDTDVEDIPPPPASPPAQTNTSYTIDDIIVFDLETTGFGTDSNIIQLAAKHMSSGKEFNTFAIPSNGYIPSKISSLTGIECHLGVMYHHSIPVPSQPIKRALATFIAWVEDTCPANAVLAAHNVKFDSRMLTNACETHNISIPLSLRYADTLVHFRRTYSNITDCKQETLVREVLKRDYEAHNAVEDCTTLSEILGKSGTAGLVLTPVSVIKYKLQCERNNKIYSSSYTNAVNEKIMTKSLVAKLSSSGLGVYHLRLVLTRSGEEGLSTIIKSRAGQCRYNIQSIVSYLNK